jgi:peptide chain release factor 1
VHLGDVVDELLDEHRLAHPGAAEEADLAALGVGREQVHDLDARHQDLGFGGLLGEGRGSRVDRARLGAHDGALLVDRLADHVEDAAQRARTHGDRDRLPGVAHQGAADEAVRRVHGDGAHRRLAEVLRNLEHEAAAVVGGFQGVQDLGQVALELHVHDGADDLGDSPLGGRRVQCHVVTLAVRAPRRPR